MPILNDPTIRKDPPVGDMQKSIRESAARTPGKKTQLEIMKAIHSF